MSTNVNLVGGWIYPGSTLIGGVSDVPTEITDGRRIDFVMPQYYTIQANGTLLQNTVANSGVDGYTAGNVAFLKAHTTMQFVTISGAGTAALTLIASSSLTTSFINTLISFLQANTLTGIELDIEIWGGITSPHYTSYKSFITTVGTALHNAGFKLVVDGPNMTAQGSSNWHWEDFDPAANPAVDYVQPLCYDNFYDTTGAGAAAAPLSWITGGMQWINSKITTTSAIIAGLNSHGYHGTTGATTGITYDDYVQSTALPGFSTAFRDAGSGELMWAQGGISYNYSDATTLQGKMNAVVAQGITNINTWHLGGGNKWYTNIPAAAGVVTNPGGTGGTGSGSTGTTTGTGASAPTSVGELTQIALYRNVRPTPVVVVDKYGNSINSNNPLATSGGGSSSSGTSVNIQDKNTLSNFLAVDTNGRINTKIQDPTTLTSFLGVDSLGRITMKERVYALLENAQIFTATPLPSAHLGFVAGTLNTNGAFQLLNNSTAKNIVVLGITVLYAAANAIHTVNLVTTDQGFGGTGQINNCKIGGAAGVATVEYANNGPSTAGTPLAVIQSSTNAAGTIADDAGLFFLPSGALNGIVVYLTITTAGNWSVLMRWAEI